MSAARQIEKIRSERERLVRDFSLAIGSPANTNPTKRTGVPLPCGWLIGSPANFLLSVRSVELAVPGVFAKVLVSGLRRSC